MFRIRSLHIYQGRLIENIVECKVLSHIFILLSRSGLIENIVECKVRTLGVYTRAKNGLIENIVECKEAHLCPFCRPCSD